MGDIKYMPVLGQLGAPFMMFGADVTHPTGAARRDPSERSIAAVVGSRDRSLGRCGVGGARGGETLVGSRDCSLDRDG